MKYEVDFLPVGEGSGDAIVIRYGDDTDGYLLHVVDGGRTETAKTIVDHINAVYPGYFINHMVLSHADDDHATGLVGVMEKMEVRNLWMNRPWLYAEQILHHFHGNFTLQGLIDDIKRRHPYLVELERLAIKNGTVIHEVFQGAQIGAFTVLAPTKGRYINSIPDFGKTPTRYTEDAAVPGFGALRALFEGAKKWLEESWNVETLANTSETSASNESCVVQYAMLEDEGILLTADVGPVGLTEAADFGALRGFVQPKFVQVPHHGSRHNVTPAVLDRWLGAIQPNGTRVGVAYCSVGSNKTDYPRGQVKNAFMRRGFQVYSTRAHMLSHSFGGGHANMSPAIPEQFAHTVEGL
ncbi:beta-lactamase superfamily II metal-dependent hydrolase [Variovorax paradoxus]|uniref:competence protein ComEC n=1 Tax=Variovorax atrisoli TaxID=3394203 RepID=UPI00119BB746|nr:competence protein ComEC [Variovorax paradoxus]MDR6523301.1 beta-lactamase superfamily II metal-dependent hydrolase [Variovorax paradoxus]